MNCGLVFLICTFCFFQCNCFQAVIQLAIQTFQLSSVNVINEFFDQQFVGRPCDPQPTDVEYDPCDLVFYIDQCQKYVENSTISCQNRVDYLHATPNADAFTWSNSTYPATQFFVNTEFPDILFANISVFDDDNLISKQFIENYKIFFDDRILQNTNWDRGFLTRPNHSKIIVTYRAQCLDLECYEFAGLEQFKQKTL